MAIISPTEQKKSMKPQDFRSFFFKLKNLTEKFIVKRIFGLPTLHCNFSTILIPPSLIKYRPDHCSKTYKLRRTKNKIANVRIKGAVLSGDWDLKIINFSYDMNYIAFKQRFIQGEDWRDTLYYDHFMERKAKRKKMRGDPDSFRKFEKHYLQHWDKLFLDIKKNGYKSQLELGKVCNDKEVEVGVSRDGEILLLGGRHRVSIAHILGIEKIPVVVNVWHKQYIDWVKHQLNTERVTPEQAIKPIFNRSLCEIRKP
ncbi:MAG: hypothetical protein D5R98_09735 [Desulfonatronovibrio sp. MSAO_Bac4]|nr:MAG: hypothetical protein D5R98_09735 [Desulfonatronovibrio sp. MSAO_Bac4]